MEIQSERYDFDDAQPWAIVLAGGVRIFMILGLVV